MALTTPVHQRLIPAFTVASAAAEKMCQPSKNRSLPKTTTSIRKLKDRFYGGWPFGRITTLSRIRLPQ